MEGITVRLLNSLDDEEIRNMKRRLVSIAADGRVDEQEKAEFDMIMKNLDVLAKAISELRMLAEKYTERSGGNGAD